MTPGSRTSGSSTSGSRTPCLSARIRVSRPGSALVADLDAEAGEVIGLIGPNGAGKSTFVQALAGTVAHTGSVRVDDQHWQDEAGNVRAVPERDVGMVWQEHLLFPHLTVRANVAFGLRSRGIRRRTADQVAQDWLDRLGVGDLADRRPGEVSGGQAQRIAIARALAPAPRVLLLDEPLSALDVTVAQSLRMELVDHLAGFDGVTILVTHDSLDAFTLTDRVVVLDEGRIAQIGSPAELSRAPATGHVARLMGLNVLACSGSGTELRLAGGGALVTVTPADGDVLATFPPAAVTLTASAPTGSARNRWPLTVHTVVPGEDAVRVHLSGAHDLIADVTPAAASDLALGPGTPVWASVKATEITVFTAATPR